MRKLALLLAVALLAPATLAEDRASTKDAERLVHKAVDYVKSAGKEKALAVFSDPNGPFTFRDLYIFVIDFKGVVLAHGTKKELIGKNDFDRKDSTGKFFTREMIELAKTKGSGWEEYQFANPTSGKVEMKVAYVERVDDYFVASGAFKP
jgi:cytochrome c